MGVPPRKGLSLPFQCLSPYLHMEHFLESWGQGFVLNVILQGNPQEHGLVNKQGNEASHNLSSVPCTAALCELTESLVTGKLGSSVSVPYYGLL